MCSDLVSVIYPSENIIKEKSRLSFIVLKKGVFYDFLAVNFDDFFLCAIKDHFYITLTLSAKNSNYLHCFLVEKDGHLRTNHQKRLRIRTTTSHHSTSSSQEQDTQDTQESCQGQDNPSIKIGS